VRQANTALHWALQASQLVSIVQQEPSLSKLVLQIHLCVRIAVLVLTALPLVPVMLSSASHVIMVLSVHQAHKAHLNACLVPMEPVVMDRIARRLMDVLIDLVSLE